MHKYFINLKRVQERAEFITREATRIKLEAFQFFEAVDAKGLNSKEISPYYKPKPWSAYWELTPTEIAVFESHRLLWEKCVQEDNGPFLICEDDILMSKYFPKVLAEISNNTNKFDIIHLDSANAVYRLGIHESWRNVVVAPILQPLSSAAAYVVSPAGAEKLAIQARSGFCDHVDDFITRPKKNYRAFQLVPAVAIQGMFAKEEQVPKNIQASERTSNPNLNHSISKGPLLYRIAKEIRRGMRKLLRKSIGDRRLVKRGGTVGIIHLARDLPGYRN